jgi:hypothetical protein
MRLLAPPRKGEVIYRFISHQNATWHLPALQQRSLERLVCEFEGSPAEWHSPDILLPGHPVHDIPQKTQL